MGLNPELSPGSRKEPGGIRFTVFSGPANRIDLCLFESPSDLKESLRIPLEPVGKGWWSILVPDATIGALYGYRVHGPYDPARGILCNPNKMLIDPYAQALGRAPVWHERLFAYNQDQPRTADSRDDSDIAPLARVIDPTFDWQGDQLPRTAREHSLIYETHVKSLTARHPEVPEHLRGSYLGLASEPVLNHLKSLGVTAVELLPVQQAFDEWHCHQNNLTNYWGYNTLLPFAPDTRFARSLSEDPAREFKTMVRALHKAGIEVLLDVVYNHSAEGGVDGPTLSYRGFDNAAYYRLDPDNPSHYQDVTGCGNSWNIDHPVARKLVLDSLRFWVEEMHVDGFRFDLASVLGRSADGFDRAHPFFTELENDPLLSQIKLIAEPWDLGHGGYQLAHFPKTFSEWNDQYRNSARRYWRGDSLELGPFARRLTGSEDIFGPQGRPPRASLNYITCHDGFTLADLVSYSTKHNAANGENNRDGNNQNFSQNCGVEGPTSDPEIQEIRERQKRNFMATLLVSLGTPMLLGGDELGKSQEGNNNAWCQDNDLNFYHWDLDARQEAFLKFTRELAQLRREHPALKRSHYFSGNRFDNAKDLAWLHPTGREMNDEDWRDISLYTVGALMRNERIPDSPSLLLLFHAAKDSDITFQIPVASAGTVWKTLIDTFNPAEPQQATDIFRLHPLSMAILEMA